MFIPKGVYFEPKAREYELGKQLLEFYEEQGVSLIPIENHNNIEEMRKKQNSEFANMKQNLIIGVRKTHKFVPNQYHTHHQVVLQCVCIVILFVITINVHI